uniref:E3 ubiquitin-protein ligase n=1 Tax=Homalodisca liturata TaxID=320908 RepID=A0A1B6JPI8_9HEMI
MADGRKAGSSGGRYLYKRRAKKSKPVEIEISDSSSDSNEDNEPPISFPSTVPPSKSTTTPMPPTSENPTTTMECPVCLQPCIHPARLPCGHIFCFLCLKGIAQQCKRCAMCRQEISPDYLDRPDLLQAPDSQNEKEAETFEDGYQWFYEGRNGWWKFDDRLTRDLEEVRELGLDKLETLICGTLYVIDLQALVQYNKETPWRRRRIKRDLAANVIIKGVAGIR